MNNPQVNYRELTRWLRATYPYLEDVPAMDYEEFVRTKIEMADVSGFPNPDESLYDESSKPHQVEMV